MPAVSLFILEEADREFTEASLWYEEQSPGLGERFIKMVETKLDLVLKFPERYPKRKGNFRETLVNIFPYIIIYTFNKKNQIVIVSSIFHASQNPRKKYRKL